MSSLPNRDYEGQLSLMEQQKQALIDRSIGLTEADKYFGMAPKPRTHEPWVDVTA